MLLGLENKMSPILDEKKKKVVRWQAAETNKGKFTRKARENPFVPLGCLMTAGVLGFGLFSFIKGDSKMQQKMMRARILAQGSTLLAVIGGLGYELYSKSQEPKPN